MKLYVLRHGIAEDAAPGQSDSDRRLTPKAATNCRRPWRQWPALECAPALLFPALLSVRSKLPRFSPENWNTTAIFFVPLHWCPTREFLKLWSEIRTHKDESNLWLASHNPLCSQLAGYLLGVPGLSVHFGKGTILCVEFDRFGPEPRGVLRWMLTARLSA